MPTLEQEFPKPAITAPVVNLNTNVSVAPPVDKMHRLVQQVGNRYLLSRVSFGIYWNSGSPSFEEFFFSPLFVGHNDITMLEAAEAAVAQFFSDAGDTNFKHCMVIGAPHTLYFTELQLQKESVRSHALEVLTAS